MTEEKILKSALENISALEKDLAVYRYAVQHYTGDSGQHRLWEELLQLQEGQISAWRKLISQTEVDMPTTVRHPGSSWVPFIGRQLVITNLLNKKIALIEAYSKQLKARQDEREFFKQVFPQATRQAKILDGLAQGRSAATQNEPWHRAARSGGMLREVVYGFNDGLTSNFGLVMGVIGTAAHSTTVLLAGISGMIADALSMAASGFLAARSEEEVRQNQMRSEEAEIALMPESESKELRAIYEGKGLERDMAQDVADQLIAQPETALKELTRDELGLAVETGDTPLKEGLVTGAATAVGAFIPIIPFFFDSGALAVYWGIALAMLFHFLVGMGRAHFTGRSSWISGLEMFVVGMGVAGIAYLIGTLLSGII